MVPTLLMKLISRSPRGCIVSASSTENWNRYTQTQAEAHSRSESEFFNFFSLMSRNHKDFIKWVSTDFGLCPKRERDGYMVLFQQWDEEENSGRIGQFLPTTIL